MKNKKTKQDKQKTKTKTKTKKQKQKQKKKANQPTNNKQTQETVTYVFGHVPMLLHNRIVILLLFSKQLLSEN